MTAIELDVVEIQGRVPHSTSRRGPVRKEAAGAVASPR
jgi:hypothetical protein